jgi:hypothetical protein
MIFGRTIHRRVCTIKASITHCILHEETEGEAAPKGLRVRGEASVPNEDKEPCTKEGKAHIKPSIVE